MGMLDEAIREHLELKRRRGADPSEVAREAREALAGPAAVAVDDGESSDHESFDDDGYGDADAGVADFGAPDERHAADFRAMGQETAELDMQAVLDEDADVAFAAAPEAPAEDAFEWESPLGGEDSASYDIPGQERMSFE